MEAISVIEIIAVLLAILYLVLAAYQNIWCWAAAAISSILYIKICYDAKLLIETGLQFFYLVMAIFGYFNWNKSTVVTINERQIVHLEKKSFILGLIICSLLSVVMAALFNQYTNAKLPWLDAPVTIFSIWATWLVIKKVIENWLMWIVIDSVAIYIYLQRDLKITAALYLIYTLLAIMGYFKWKKLQIVV